MKLYWTHVRTRQESNVLWDLGLGRFRDTLLNLEHSSRVTLHNTPDFPLIIMPLVVDPSSTCDICLENYSVNRRCHALPCGKFVGRSQILHLQSRQFLIATILIQILIAIWFLPGHIFCGQCLRQIRSHTCPICRENALDKIETQSTRRRVARKLYVDFTPSASSSRPPRNILSQSKRVERLEGEILEILSHNTITIQGANKVAQKVHALLERDQTPAQVVSFPGKIRNLIQISPSPVCYTSQKCYPNGLPVYWLISTKKKAWIKLS